MKKYKCSKKCLSIFELIIEKINQVLCSMKSVCRPNHSSHLIGRWFHPMNIWIMAVCGPNLIGAKYQSKHTPIVRIFGSAKFQLYIIFTFRVMILLVDESGISVKLSDFPGYHSITLKVQVMRSWNFECQNILKKCAWKHNFSHFCS